MRKLYLFTITLLAIGAMYFAPVTVEAFDPLGSPTVAKDCASCHVETGIETDLGHIVKSEVEQVAMEATAGWPLFIVSRTVYGEETTLYRRTHSSFVKGSSKVPL